MLQLELQHALQGLQHTLCQLLHSFNTITSTAVAITITIHSILYSRESEQYVSDRKIPVRTF